MEISRLKITALESNKDSIIIIIIKVKKINEALTPKCFLKHLLLLNRSASGYYNAAAEPGEKIEFSSLMYEIKVLPLNYPGWIRDFTSRLGTP